MGHVKQPRLLKRLASGFEYVVQEGDTLADVLRITGSSVCELAARNPHCNPLRLRPGQRLRVPPIQLPRPNMRFYRVRRGEDVYAVARKFNRSVISLLKINSHLLPGEISRGAFIVLPKE